MKFDLVGKVRGLLFLSAVFYLLLAVAAPSVCAQTVADNRAVCPCAETLNGAVHRTWQIGAFAMGGWPPGYTVYTPETQRHEDFQFYSAGVEAGRMLTASHGPGFLRGRGEALVEVLPFWQDHIPLQAEYVYARGTSTNPLFWGVFKEGDYHGLSVTPLMLRWNFMGTNASRFVPWLQAGGGILWTSKRFPQPYIPDYPQEQTSRFNFTPQFGFGESLFVRKNQSLNIGVRGIEYGSLGLGSYDPGVGITIQFTAGYSWWK